MSLFARCLLKKACINIPASRCASTGSAMSQPIYELRIYSVYPKHLRALIELTTRWIHLRTAKSTCVGYWFSDLGGINDAVHLWEYESLGHRADVRQQLSEDKSWKNNYIAPVMSMWYRQDNAVLALKQGTQLNTSSIKPGGVYELQSMSRNLQLGPLPDGTVTIGHFNTIVGPVRKDIRLLHHSSIDNVIQASPKSLEGAKDADIQTRILLPAPWSDLK